MSLELHVFIRAGEMPARDSWQAKIRELGFPVELDPEMKVGSDEGFSPCTVKGQASGFEISFESSKELLDDYPNIRTSVRDRDACITFRWGGDMLECACVMAATAALAGLCDAVSYYPDDDILYSPHELVTEANTCLDA